MLSYLLPLLIGSLFVAFFAGKPYWIQHQRKRARRLPFPKQWRKIIQQRMPYFKQMPAHLQLQLKQHIQVFLSEKRFVGHNGIVINDEIRVTIAAQACLLLLNRNTDYYPKLRTILVYPRAFVKEHSGVSDHGVHFSEHVTLAGESWGFGKVVLSWQDTVKGANDPNDGHNVVIHEFAHQLDQENGAANGAPILSKGQRYDTWSDTLSQEFETLQRQAGLGHPSIFDYYGATNPAEFFAVASEVFFEKSVGLKHEHPALYQQLFQYYGVDPAAWHKEG